MNLWERLLQVIGLKAKKRQSIVVELDERRRAKAVELARRGIAKLKQGAPAEAVQYSRGSIIPDGASIGRLTIEKGIPIELPERITCREFAAVDSVLRVFRATWKVSDRLDLTNCADLVSLPDGLNVPTIVLRGCRKLTLLPAGMEANFLDLTGCEWIELLPPDLKVSIGRLAVRDCRRLRWLPESIGPLARLDVSGCPLISELPASLCVQSAVDIGGTGIRSLPPGCRDAQLMWRGVPIDERIAFRPQEIRGKEVLAERNAERRRVMLERIGFERFISEVSAEVLDTDRDAGGERKLLRVALEGDEDLVCVSVKCPSTGRQYLLRVPPKVRTCHEAVAWTAGFEEAAAYRPIVET